MIDPVIVLPLVNGAKSAIQRSELTIASKSASDKVLVVPLRDGSKSAITLNNSICPCCNWSWDGWTVYTNTPNSANFTEYHGIVEFVYADGSWTITPSGHTSDELSPPCYTKYENVAYKRLSTGYCGFWKPTPGVLPYHYDVKTGMQRILSNPITITGFRMYLYCYPQSPGSTYADVVLNGTYTGRTYGGDGWVQVSLSSGTFPGGSLDLSTILIYRYSSVAFNGLFPMLCSGIELEIDGKWVCFDSPYYKTIVGDKVVVIPLKNGGKAAIPLHRFTTSFYNSYSTPCYNLVPGQNGDFQYGKIDASNVALAVDDTMFYFADSYIRLEGATEITIKYKIRSRVSFFQIQIGSKLVRLYESPYSEIVVEDPPQEDYYKQIRQNPSYPDYDTLTFTAAEIGSGSQQSEDPALFWYAWFSLSVDAKHADVDFFSHVEFGPITPVGNNTNHWDHGVITILGIS